MGDKTDTSPIANEPPPFGEVARRAIRRITIAKWLAGLSRTAIWVYPAAALILLFCHLSGFRFVWTIAVVVVALHFLATSVWAWLRRPNPVSALAYWDEAAGRDEMFTSAYCFEQQRAVSLGEQLHVAKARVRLEKDIHRLRPDLPTSAGYRAWALPVALLALCIGLVAFQTDRTRGEAVDESAKAQAKKVANELDERLRNLDQSEDLSPEEKEKIRKLEASLSEMQKKLRGLSQETPRDVLAELEKRAHEAEELAKSLNAADLKSLSSEMIAELERHADTTEFGSSLRAEELEDVANESDELADRLEDDELGLEEKERIEQALAQAMAKADQTDRESLVGKHLQESLKGLRRKKPKEAAKPFRRLAKQYRDALQRLARQKQLQDLADQLRNSGQQIFGRQNAGIRQLASNPVGMRQLGLKPMAPMGTMPLPLGQGQQIQVALPGGQLPWNPKNVALLPIPGTGQMPPTAMIPGGGQCPIPGTGQFPGGQCLGGQGAGMSPVPGVGAGVGGHFAGHGSAAYGNTATKPLAATRTGQVQARIGREGPSMVRNVDRGDHKENTTRELTNDAIATVQAEEEALADEPLPLARRKQILRYFTALRRQLVEQSGNHGDSP